MIALLLSYLAVGLVTGLGMLLDHLARQNPDVRLEEGFLCALGTLCVVAAVWPLAMYRDYKWATGGDA